LIKYIFLPRTKYLC